MEFLIWNWEESLWEKLMITRICERWNPKISCLCDNACKRSLVILWKEQALWSSDRCLSCLLIYKTILCAKKGYKVQTNSCLKSLGQHALLFFRRLFFYVLVLAVVETFLIARNTGKEWCPTAGHRLHLWNQFLVQIIHVKLLNYKAP